MMKDALAGYGTWGFPKRFAEAAMLAGLTKTIRLQSLPRLLGFLIVW